MEWRRHINRFAVWNFVISDAADSKYRRSVTGTGSLTAVKSKNRQRSPACNEHWNLVSPRLILLMCTPERRPRAYLVERCQEFSVKASRFSPRCIGQPERVKTIADCHANTSWNPSMGRSNVWEPITWISIRLIALTLRHLWKRRCSPSPTS